MELAEYINQERIEERSVRNRRLQILKCLVSYCLVLVVLLMTLAFVINLSLNVRAVTQEKQIWCPTQHGRYIPINRDQGSYQANPYIDILDEKSCAISQ